jgi:fumarate hydratase class II
MLVTALAPTVGYDKAAAIAHRATADDLPLREAALAEGIDADLFDRIVIPADMTHPHR